MLLKTIMNSKISDTMINQIILDPKGIAMMMNISFLINIFMFVVSILSVSYLCVVRPENPLFYFLPAFLVVFYFKTIFAYREYFVVFIDAFNLQYDILKKISTMSDEEQESFFFGIDKDIKNKFLSYKKGEF
jgi:hypothetical protein